MIIYAAANVGAAAAPDYDDRENDDYQEDVDAAAEGVAAIFATFAVAAFVVVVAAAVADADAGDDADEDEEATSKMKIIGYC
jgi:hypothetical protein